MKGIHISGEERALLWACLQHDTLDAVKAVVASVGSHDEKAIKIIRQLDFIFELRMTVANTPSSGGGIWLDLIPQKYLIGILGEQRVAALQLTDRVLFYKYRDALLFKLGDQERAQAGLPDDDEENVS